MLRTLWEVKNEQATSITLSNRACAGDKCYGLQPSDDADTFNSIPNYAPCLTRSRDGTAHTVPDDGLWKRRRLADASKFIEDFDIGPSGKRALFSARGDIFTVPAKHGPTRDLTRTSGAHDRDAAWSPDGTSIAFISDASGEDEVWIVPAGGEGKPRQLTHDGSMMRLHPVWSPDGARIAVSDKEGRIGVVTVADGSVVQEIVLPGLIRAGKISLMVRYMLLFGPVVTDGRLLLEARKGLEVYGNKPQ